MLKPSEQGVYVYIYIYRLIYIYPTLKGNRKISTYHQMKALWSRSPFNPRWVGPNVSVEGNS